MVTASDGTLHHPQDNRLYTVNPTIFNYHGSGNKVTFMGINTAEISGSGSTGLLINVLDGGGVVGTMGSW